MLYFYSAFLLKNTTAFFMASERGRGEVSEILRILRYFNELKVQFMERLINLES
jgi:hypothetical protein